MRRIPRSTWILAALIAIVVAPLGVAAVSLRRPQWYPVLDLAMTELRLRDVFTSNTPLIGLPGRIGQFPEQGSHPGPMSFYALWPIWKVLGSSAWGMQVSALVLNAIACAGSVLVAHRRGGLRLSAAVAALLAVLMGGFGISALAEPWNPYLPLMWWVLTLLAVWSVLCGDFAMLPVAAVGASMAAQTHVPYLGLCLGLLVLVAGWLVRSWRTGADRAAIRRWSAIALGIAVLLWSPLLVDQATNEPGNLSMLWQHFTSPPEGEGPTVGIGDGFELQLRHLDVTAFAGGRGEGLGSLARTSGDGGGSLAVGVAVLLAWAGAVVVAWRRRHAMLVRLHAVVAVVLVLGVYSTSRIFGKVWYYLVLWSWGTVVLLVLSTAWTAAVVIDRHRVTRAALGSLVGAAVVSTVLLSVDSARLDPPSPQLSAVLAAVVPPTATALDVERRYLVTWDDTFYIGSQGYGLVSDLERLGFDVGVPRTWRVPVTHHRVYDEGDVDAEIRLAVGGFVTRWRSYAEGDPAVRELAFSDARDADAIAEYERLRQLVSDDLRAVGLGQHVPLVDRNLFGLSIVPDLPDTTRRRVERMLELGSPAAVFLVPPGLRLDES